MNAKEITFTDKETGETTTGTVNQISELIKVSRQTLTTWIKKGETEKYLFSNVKQNPANVKTEPNVKTEEENTPNVKQTNSNVKLDPPKVKDVTKGIKTDPQGKVLLPRKPCIKCGQPVYHTLKIDGKIQHICFNSCTPQIINVIKPINQQTLEYIRAFNKANAPKEKEISDI
jgi:hypothetical protein